MKTDNPELVGQHVFERAGLGKAPFRFVAMTENVYCACQGAPAQPGGTCDYCSNSIRYEFHLRSSDGRRFKVGCDCINKAGDRGLIQAYKSSPAFRSLQREKRAAKAKLVHAELETLIRERGDELAKFPAPNDKSPNLHGHVVWWFEHAGASGRAAVLRFAKRVLAGTTVHNGTHYQEAQ